MGVRPAKRIGRVSGNALAALAVLMLFLATVQALPLLPRPPSDDQTPEDPPTQVPGRASSVVDEKLFFCSTGIGGTPYLGTTPPTSAQSTSNLPIELSTELPLSSAIEIAGKDSSGGASGAKGMWMWFQLNGVAFNNLITIVVLENNATVAQTTISMGSSGLKRWDVPFTDTLADSHTFAAGSKIRVRISASIPLTPIVYNNAQSYLLLPLTSYPIVPGVQTSYAPDKATDEFQPYWPDALRKIRTEGDIATVFGPSDIASVLVTIRSPSGDIASNSTAAVTATHYLNTWNYPKAQVPGNYNITVRVTDRQGHEYYAYTVVEMLRYGAYISSRSMDEGGVAHGAASPPRGGSDGTNAAYTLDILNSGYSDTSVTIRVSSEPPPGWTAVLGTTSLPSLAAGASTNITFTVSPGAEVEYGDKAVIYVEAVADADPRTPKSSWTIQTVTNATMSRNFDFSAVGPTEAWVDVGQTVGYQMLVRNKGVLDMNLTFSVAGTPVGWSYQLDVSGLVHLDTGSNSERTINMRVTAPPEEVGNLSRIAQITVTAQALEDPNLEKTVTTVTHLITILGLSVSPQVRTSDLDVLNGKAEFSVTIGNLDPINSHQVRLTVTAPAEWPPSSVNYGSKESQLSPNQNSTITVSITPPATALANEATGYPITVKVEPLDQPSRSNTTTVTLKVKQKYGISLDASPKAMDAKPGKEVTVTLTVRNLGNGNDTVIVYIAASIPEDWKVYLDKALSPSSLSVPLSPTGHAGDSRTINLTIQPSSSTKDKAKVNINVSAKSPGAAEVSKAVSVTVNKDFIDALKDAVWDSMIVILMSLLVFTISGLAYRRSKA